MKSHIPSADIFAVRSVWSKSLIQQRKPLRICAVAKGDRMEINMAKTKKCCSDKDPARLNKVGGQAVLEGVMMKAGERTVTTCRKEDGTLTVNDGRFVSVRKKHKILNLPILRGIINFIEMMALSFRTLSVSAEALGIEEADRKEKAKKLEKKNEKRRAKGKAEIKAKEPKDESALIGVIMIIATILGVALALFLFMFLPTKAADGINWLVTYFGGSPLHPTVLAVVEGVSKIVIFLTYLWLVSLIPDIKRTFMYHGAEHKSIACFESGEELSPENARKHTRFHPRCGTSFMFVMILLGIFVGMIVNNVFVELPRIAIVGIRILILPLVVGIGYEFIMFAGKHDNPVTRALSAPGLWVQRLTTKEPTDDMLEVAIISIKCALRDDFPEFGEYYAARPWEPKAEESEAVECDTTVIDGDCASACDSEDPCCECGDTAECCATDTQDEVAE